jgi:hypothetical protein
MLFNFMTKANNIVYFKPYYFINSPIRIIVRVKAVTKKTSLLTLILKTSVFQAKIYKNFNSKKKKSSSQNKVVPHQGCKVFSGKCYFLYSKQLMQLYILNYIYNVLSKEIFRLYSLNHSTMKFMLEVGLRDQLHFFFC